MNIEIYEARALKRSLETIKNERERAEFSKKFFRKLQPFELHKNKRSFICNKFMVKNDSLKLEVVTR